MPPADRSPEEIAEDVWRECRRIAVENPLALTDEQLANRHRQMKDAIASAIARDRAERGEPRAVAGWRYDMDNAPKDGRLIIVLGGVARWHDGRWCTVTGESFPGAPITWPVEVWQPFPAPPSPKEASAASPTPPAGAEIERLRAEGRRDGIEASLNAIKKRWPPAHTYASENADIYHAQDRAVEEVTKAVRALLSTDPAPKETQG